MIPILLFFFFNDTATTEIYPLSLHDALPISPMPLVGADQPAERHREADQTTLSRSPLRLDLRELRVERGRDRSEEHTSELQSLRHLVCRLLLEKKKLKVRKLYRMQCVLLEQY